MIYLIESSAFKKTNENKTKIFMILKIGYVADNKVNKKLQDLLLQNPTAQILSTIPEATQEHEERIHKLFENLKVPENIIDQNKEWFWYNNSILEFFENLENIKELEKKLKTYKKPEGNIKELDILEILCLSEKIKRIGNQEYREEKLSTLEKLSDKLKNNPKINDIQDLLELLELEYNGITEKLLKYLDLKPEQQDFLEQFETITSTEKGLDLLYSGKLNENMIEEILEFLPDNYSSHYYLIGKRKLSEILTPDIILEKQENDKNLEKLIYQEINPETVYEEKELEEIVKNILQKLGMKLGKNESWKNYVGKFYSIRELDNGKIKLL